MVQKSSALLTENIKLRATRHQKALIDGAAETLGRSRSEFIRDAVCRESESVLLDRTQFNLSEDEFRRFVAILDAPSADNPRLAELLKRKAPWEK